MNEYGRRVRDHYRQFLPTRYAQIPDPETHFSTLGQQIEAEVEAAETDLAGADPANEDYLTKVGRLNMAKLQAEELVMARFVPDPVGDLDDPKDNPAAEQMLAWSRQDQQDRTEQAQSAQERLDHPTQ